MVRRLRSLRLTKPVCFGPPLHGLRSENMLRSTKLAVWSLTPSSIIRSRGTAHSNQVRELILSDAGVTLTDTHTAGGDVLMGTLRYQKESAERIAKEVADVAGKLKRVRLDADEAELEVRVKSL